MIPEQRDILRKDIESIIKAGLPKGFISYSLDRITHQELNFDITADSDILDIVCMFRLMMVSLNKERPETLIYRKNKKITVVETPFPFADTSEEILAITKAILLLNSNHLQSQITENWKTISEYFTVPEGYKNLSLENSENLIILILAKYIQALKDERFSMTISNNIRVDFNTSRKRTWRTDSNKGILLKIVHLQECLLELRIMTT